ncbi:MAG: DUF975 family protein [Lachnospiraceae bacterium]
MTRTIPTYKRLAMNSLREQLQYPILVFLFIEALSIAISVIFSLLTAGSSTYAIGMQLITSVILTLVLYVLTSGESYLYLNLARGKKVQFSDVFYFFKHHPDRVILASIPLTLLSTASSYTVTLLLSDALVALTAGETYTPDTTLLLITALLFVITFFMNLFFYFYTQLLADHDTLGGFASLKESVLLLRGHKGRLFLLLLSFIGWNLLAVVTCGLIYIWLHPYLQTSITYFYLDITGELDNPVTAQEESPLS